MLERWWIAFNGCRRYARCDRRFRPRRLHCKLLKMSTFSTSHSSESVVEKDKFVTDMIASVDGELVFDLPEGMTMSPMVDQILA